jgi:hypothetical protein
MEVRASEEGSAERGFEGGEEGLFSEAIEKLRECMDERDPPPFGVTRLVMRLIPVDLARAPWMAVGSTVGPQPDVNGGIGVEQPDPV